MSQTKDRYARISALQEPINHLQVQQIAWMQVPDTTLMGSHRKSRHLAQPERIRSCQEQPRVSKPDRDSTSHQRDRTPSSNANREHSRPSRAKRTAPMPHQGISWVGHSNHRNPPASQASSRVLPDRPPACQPPLGTTQIRRARQSRSSAPLELTNPTQDRHRA